MKPDLRYLLSFIVASVAGYAHAQPTVNTLPASAVGTTNATLNGSATPLGASTFGRFEWGTTTNYGNLTVAQGLGSGNGNVNFNQNITGLSGGVTYHFRALASNSVGTVQGTNASFTTAVFSDIGAGLTNVFDGSVAWGDYDNDGRLDILLTGSAIIGKICQVWRNTGSGFTNVDPNLPGIYSSSATWADYDNDGRLDFLVMGFNNADSSTSQLWRNTVSGFSNLGGLLPTSLVASAAWGDFDSEGRLDILVGGANFQIGSVSQIWRNNGNSFLNINAGLPGISASSVAGGDYDNDGRPDLLLSGSTGSGYIAQVWRNTGNGFTNINAGLPGVTFSSVAWGDYDNDGRLDILLTGTTNGSASGVISRIYRNTSGGFVNQGVVLPGVMDGSVAWGDYDNDGRLDFLLTGTTNGSASGALLNCGATPAADSPTSTQGCRGFRRVPWRGAITIMMAGWTFC